MQELNSPTNILLSYRCYAVYIVENTLEVEKRINSIIDKIDDSLHAREQLDNGRIREREFFKISPEAAYGVFKEIAYLRGDTECLQLYTPTLAQAQEQELAESRTKRSSKNSFALLNIAVGEKITFLYDDTISAKVLNNKNLIEYQGEQYSVTGLARKILIESFGWTVNLHVNGWRYFTKDGVTLSDIRATIESCSEEEE